MCSASDASDRADALPPRAYRLPAVDESHLLGMQLILNAHGIPHTVHRELTENVSTWARSIEVNVLRKPFCFLCLLLLAAIDVSGAQAAVRQDSAGNTRSNLSGTWSANSNGGLTLAGTWTAVPDPATGAVTGTWTLVDAHGNAIAAGGWSAAKSPTRWNGAWRAVVAGRDGEYSGTWTAAVDLKADARLVDLFEKAIQAAVGGHWRAGNRSGAWSIRSSR